MSDTKISALPVVSSIALSDSLPIVQGSGATAATRRISVGQLRSNFFADREILVEDFGAVGNGTTDDGPAIQAAVNSLTGRGGTICFAAKKYRIATPVLINSETIILQGDGFTEGPAPDDGTWFLIDSTGFTPFTFTSVEVRGSAVRDIAFHQIHNNAVNASWTPNNYDYVIRVQDCLGAIDFRNLFFCGINRGIFCDNSGRINIERVRGQIYSTGVEIDRCLDIPRIEHFHLWTFVTSDPNIIGYQQQNMDSILLRRVDGIFMDDIFVLGARSVFRFASSVNGVTTKFYIGHGYTDFAKYSLWIEGNDVTGQIANLTTQGELIAPIGAPIPGGAGIRIDGANSRVQIANLRLDALESSAIQINNVNNRLDIFALRADRVNLANNGSPVIRLANVSSGTPNQVYLGSPPVIGNSNGAILVNAATNGFVAMMAPAGTIARPGAMVGATDTGFSLPATGQIAMSAGGLEVFRATSAGTVTIGGSSGTDGLGVVTPAGTVNQVRITGASAGAGPSISANGTDANVALRLSAKGAAPVSALSPLQLPSFTVATLPAAASYARSLIFVADGAANRRLAVSDGASWRWPDGTIVS